MNRDQLILAITNAPNRGMPDNAHKALVRIAVAAVGALFNEPIPPLDPPHMDARFSMLSDVHLFGILLSRWGAEEELKRREWLKSQDIA